MIAAEDGVIVLSGPHYRVMTKVVKDVVHQFIEMPSDFIDSIVDTILLQRLRRIQQLSLAQEVYPGAVHTRFEHSLGVAFTMKRAIHHIARNLREIVVPRVTEEVKVLRGEEEAKKISSALRMAGKLLLEFEKEAVTAALLHDVGHIALSHISEQGLKDPILEYAPKSRPFVGVDVDHEKLTVELIDGLAKTKYYRPVYNGEPVNLDVVSDILKIAYGEGSCNASIELGGNDLDAQVRSAVKCIIAKLLNSNIDVDRADYILRDSIHTGNLSGIYDLNRYYSVLTIVPFVKYVPRGVEVELDLGVLEKGVRVVENMLLARIYMYSDVYLHDVSMTYSAMASRVIALLYLAALEAIVQSSSTRGGNSGGDIRRLLEKYPFLEDLAGIDYLAKVYSRDDFERAVLKLNKLVDDQFYSLIYQVAIGNANDLLRFISMLDDTVAAPKGVRGWYKEACFAVSALSYGIIARRHASSLILSDDRRVVRILNIIEGRNPVVIENLSRLMTPLVTLTWSTYVPYKRGKGMDVKVFRKKNSLVTLDLTESEQARLARELADKVYAKMIVTYLGTGKMGDGESKIVWTRRKGKLTAEEVVEWMRLRGMLGACGLTETEALKMVEEASSRAEEIARLLYSYSS